jgi:hypothetical protein
LESLKRNALSESLLESGVILIVSIACEKGSSGILDCLSDVRRVVKTLLEFLIGAKPSSDVSLSVENFPENFAEFRRSVSFLGNVIGVRCLAETFLDSLVDTNPLVDLESFSEAIRLVETSLESVSAIMFSACCLLESLRTSARSAEVLMRLCPAIDSVMWLFI